jgi:hypothetical protein
MLALIVCAATVLAPQGQVVIDRIMAVVNGDVITQSDVRAARLLQLVPDEPDAAVVRRLVDRRLVLAELQRFQAPPASPEDIAVRRAEWERARGTESVSDLLMRAGVQPWFVDRWLANDIRMERYVAQRFAALSDDRRAAAISAWRESLRTRAEIVYRD